MSEREIFEGALEYPDPACRRAYLDRVCGDAAMRERVDALLASHEAASQFLNVPAPEQLRSVPESGPTRTFDTSRPGGAAPGDDYAEATEVDLSFLNPPSARGGLGTLDHYEVLKLLGRGAFGLVFKAFDERLHRYVAIKVLDPRLAATSPPRKRFLREARSAAAVRHENVVQVHAVEEHPLPYLVMEFVDGATLHDRLNGTGPLEVPEILHLGRQMAVGLAAAHEKGLIHRDIKPGNVLIEAGAERRVKITDFGLARAADDASLTRSGVISGTPMYMAPEQAQGLPLDHRADLFSLGSVLYQMASGRPPFRAETTFAVLKRVVDDTPRPIREILPTVPDWLCGVIAKLHAKRPEDRFQSAREVADLLARYQAGLQPHGSVEPPAELVPQSPRSFSLPRPRRYSGVAVVVLLGVVALAVVLWLQSPPNPMEPGPIAVEPTVPTAPLGEVTPPVRIVRKAMDYDEIVTGPWTDLVTDPKDFDALINANPQRSPQGTYAYHDGTLEIKAGQLTFPVPPTDDAIVRARVRKTGHPEGNRNLNLKLRVSEAGYISGCYNGQGHFCLGRLATRWQPLAMKTYPGFNDTEEFELAVAVIGRRAWLFANGLRVLTADLDVDLPPGRPDVGLHDNAHTETAFFRQVQYQSIPPGALGTAAKPATPIAQQAYERAAASAMRKLGVPLLVRAAGQDLYVRPNDSLPYGSFALKAVYMASIRQLGRMQPLEPLRWCDQIEELRVDNCLVFNTDLDWLENCPSLTALNVNSTDLGGNTIAGLLKNADELRKLECWGISFTNDSLKPLADKPIEEVDFSSWNLDSGCAETIRNWKKLKTFRLAYSAIGDEFLAHAESWPELERLHVYNNSKIGDRGVAHLQKCPKLADLHLGETAITDESLTHLAKVSSLKKLTVTKTKVTAAGVAAFRQARPDCVVVWDNKP